MDQIIHRLKVKGFRSLRDVEIGPFGAVNLLTGRNNSGKSTILEAIRLLVTKGATRTFIDILDYREELESRIDQSFDDTPVSYTPDDVLAFCSLFSDFPPASQCIEPLTIANLMKPGGKKPKNSIAISIVISDDIIGEGEVNFQKLLLPKNNSKETSRGTIEGIPYLRVTVNGDSRHIRIDDSIMGRKPFYVEPPISSAVPCIFVDPFSSRSTRLLSSRWDSIALTDAEKDVVKALQLISPDIKAISMIGRGTTGRSRYGRTAMARSSAYAHPVPLRSFGDGVNRLFGLILSMVCAKRGVLLVDEFENGLHHTILADVWKTIFTMAHELNVQVFATTHSWDCIEAFQIAASESPSEGVLARLTMKDNKVIPTLFREEELQVITRDGIEVR